MRMLSFARACVFLAVAVSVGAIGFRSANAAGISVNFAENASNQGLDGTTPIGPLSTAIWNSTINRDSGTLAAGTKNNLVDDSNTATTADITWSSSNVWYNADGVSSQEARLAVGYLDDGGSGVSITVTDVPYAQYVVYGLMASDQGQGLPAAGQYYTKDFKVNGVDVLGAATSAAYKGIADSNTAEGAFWTLLTSSNVGNYWVSGVQTSSTLTVTGLPRAGQNSRGSISGLIIQQVPEPSSLSLLALAGLGMLRFRRRR